MKEITVTELAALTGATVIDVREPDEYAAVRVPGVINIPLGQLTEAELPDEPLYVICASGGRSARATDYLASRDLDATNVAGGTNGWVQAGLPTERGPSA
ncbi:rhodanese-like domain-containing protein [Subtercola vilae]|uniref:Rhodanese-like domain-containing protein n=1 Tax=Subtercola vilae TaxID=2056433 RepID=A0A4T2BWC9_9MICO|nr:rhodanese-like domain-containing protein [Subtercola vilae]TIH35302.1 rhodanese-like domain-containing protein [Subtercola vilae]